MLLSSDNVLSRKFIVREQLAAKEDTQKRFFVFLVDDDRVFLNALSHFLTLSLPPQFNIITFTTAADCLKAMQLNPDIIVLDYFLSSDPAETKNGLAVLKALKQNAPGSRVVVLSSQKNSEVISDLFDEGAYDYVQKNENSYHKLLEIIKTSSDWYKSEEELDRRTNRRVIVISILLFLLAYTASIVIW